MSSYKNKRSSNSKSTYRRRPVNTSSSSLHGNRKRKKNKRSKKSIFMKIGLFILFFVIIFLIAGTIYVMKIANSLPKWDDSSFISSSSSILYDKDSNIISQKYSSVNRIPISYTEMSPVFIKAVIATEDSNFFTHKGYSITGMLRSMVSNASSDTIQGASTITQQLARGVFMSYKQATTKSIDRKIKELFLSMQIESRYTKEEIFTLYANNCDFGNNAKGVEAASQTYFGKRAKDLTQGESTLLAGMIQGPSLYNPYTNPKNALKRRDHVVDRMIAQGYLTNSAGAKIKNEALKLNTSPISNIQPDNSLKNSSYYIDAASTEAESIVHNLGLESIYKAGYKIYTAMDKNIQGTMENVFNTPSFFPAGKNGRNPQAAMVLLDERNGNVLGVVGGRTYTTSMGLNRATQSVRQPGSSFKPIASFAPAIEEGVIAPSVIIKDTATPDLKDSKGKVIPMVNYEGKPTNQYFTMRDALKESINTIPVRISNQIGPQKGFDLAVGMGITSLDPSERDNLSLSLGGLQNGVSPIQLANAYASFADGGISHTTKFVTKIVDNYGKVVYNANYNPKTVISPQTSYIITDMLRGVIRSGTGVPAQIYGRDLAGKTGTTDYLNPDGSASLSANTDVWFVGYSPEYTASVWIGYDQTDAGHNLANEYKSGMAARIWKTVMESALSGLPNSKFVQPKGISSRFFDDKGLPTDKDTGKKDLFIDGKNPTNTFDAINGWDDASKKKAAADKAAADKAAADKSAADKAAAAKTADNKAKN